MMHKLVRTAVFSCILVGLTQIGSANLIEYNLAGSPGTQLFNAPSLVAPNLTGLNLVRSPGIVPSTGSNSMNSNTWSVGQYYTFGFTVAPSYQANLSLLEIGTSASNTGPRSFSLYSSADGFTSSIATINHGDGTTNFGFVNSSINLSSLTGLTGNVEFRLQVDVNLRVNANSTIASTGSGRITNYFAPSGPGLPNVDTGAFRVIGTVSAIPEPSSVLLLSLASTLIVFRRFR